MGQSGKHFFHGPYEYYFLLPAFLLFNGDPLILTLFVVFFNAAAPIFLYFSLLKLCTKKEAALCTAAIFSIPAVIIFTTSIWNPHFLLPFTTALLFLHITKKSNSFLRNFLIGLCTGVGILLHYQAILLIPLSCWFFWREKLSPKQILSYLIGLGLSLSPFFLFEMRHDFYNIRMMISILATLEGRTKEYTTFPVYYFLGFLPFFSYAAVKAVQRIFPKNPKKILVYSSILILIFSTIAQAGKVYDWQENWNYIYAQEAAQIIENDRPNNFNVAYLVTGDTRAHAIRFLLIRNGSTPNSVLEYPESERLYIVRPTSRSLTENPPWEISSFPGCERGRWPIGENQKYEVVVLHKDCE